MLLTLKSFLQSMSMMSVAIEERHVPSLAEVVARGMMLGRICLI